MKTAIIITAAFTIILLSCKSDHGDIQEHRTVKKSEYPLIIDSLGLQDLYSQTKWLMYCFQSDDTLKPNKPNDTGSKITFGMLDLKYDTIRQYGDTLTEIDFMFFNGETQIDDGLFQNVPIWGVAYSKPQYKVAYYIMYADGANWRRDSCPPKMNCKSRFVEPLQPEVIKYINDNKTKLNPWFYKEAVRRGIIKG